ncbi:unnamed protein product [Arabis nemorensis]|uniref:MATH domain-containing protein n=1 Tax=Arabis nemorensis TaxID=586526 RepID=A0A565BZS8_9BRAS|nr:unnamed protein product [Arabis nemorensis]
MEETRDHLLLTCGYSMEVWRMVMARIRPNFTLFTSWNELLSWIRDNLHPPIAIQSPLKESVSYHLQLVTMSRPETIERMVELFKSRHSASHLFKIDNFSLLTKYHIERVESSVFILGGHKWKLYVYPNGNNSANGHVSIFIENQDSIIVQLKYQIFVVSQLKPIWHPSSVILNFGTTSIPQMRGTPRLISLVDLKSKGYLIEDCCLFGVKFDGFENGAKGSAECFSLIEKPINHKATWMMTKFSSFEPEMYHYSNEFVVGTRKWKIKIHPSGIKEGKDKSFSVYLVGEGFINNAPKAKTYAKFKLRVLDQVNRNHFEKSDSCWVDVERDENNGFEDFMPLKKLDRPYLVNNKLYVGVEFDVISMTTTI